MNPMNREGGPVLTPTILHVNSRLNMSRAQPEEATAHLAEPFAAVPGCRWRIWLVNEVEREAGGVYNFEAAASQAGLLAGPLMAGVRAHPAISDFSVKRFDVVEEATRLTRGPIGVRDGA
jgi:hypothetical protein